MRVLRLVRDQRRTLVLGQKRGQFLNGLFILHQVPLVLIQHVVALRIKLERLPITRKLCVRSAASMATTSSTTTATVISTTGTSSTIRTVARRPVGVLELLVIFRRLFVSINDGLVPRLGTIIQKMVWISTVEAGTRQSFKGNNSETRRASPFGPLAGRRQTMIGSQGELSDRINGRPFDNSQSRRVSFNLTATFQVHECLVEVRDSGTLKQPKQVTTEVVSDVVAICIGRVLQKTNCSVDSSDDVVNVFSLIFTDLECPASG